MQPRFVGRLALADVVTVVNAAVGFAAAAAATHSPSLAARLVLLGAIADGLDGVLARRYGSSPAGEFLDSLADVATFAVAPAMLVFAVASGAWGLAADARTAAAVGLPAAFVAVAVLRLGLYTADDVGNDHTVGVQSTLAATLLAAGYLAGVTAPVALLAATALFCYLMVAPVRYPDLYARDALVLGGLQALAVLFPTVVGGVFPRALLVAALAYLLLSPRFYWRE
ncbi:protein sorting system archaetidylserine synthase [Halorarius halobius]|uniref:protein sorting system archaetidylserine synthase n=1 Tax=Halorarius halobius TaxID=2962671 RepID=UPI0020CF5C8B|nr:protein sorting system archaetidylserine synthase [Halorarius halobius]